MNLHVTHKTFTFFDNMFQQFAMRTIAGLSSPKVTLKADGHNSHVELVHIISPLRVEFHVLVDPPLAYVRKPSGWSYLITYVLCSTSKCRGTQGCSVCHKYWCDTALLVLILHACSTHWNEFALMCAKLIRHNMWKSIVHRWTLQPICCSRPSQKRRVHSKSYWFTEACKFTPCTTHRLQLYVPLRFWKCSTKQYSKKMHPLNSII